MSHRNPTHRIAVGLALGAAVVLTGCAQGAQPGPGGTPSRAASTTPAPAPSTPSSSATASSGSAVPAVSTPAATSDELTGVPVYWVGESRSSLALFRELRTVPAVGGRVASAVAAMTRMTPLDPDYLTPWRPASRVRVTQSGDALTVDLSADAIANTQVGSELAERAVQQLVYTATAAARQAGRPARTVTITIDGKARDAWGAVRLGTPTARAPMASVQAHAWVTTPQEGARLRPGKVSFTGFGTSFEATFGWKVTSRSGGTVAKGFAMGGTGDGGFGEMRFSATLRPGTYTVVLSTDDPSGGTEGPGPAVDDKRFTVR